MEIIGIFSCIYRKKKSNLKNIWRRRLYAPLRLHMYNINNTGTRVPGYMFSNGRRRCPMCIAIGGGGQGCVFRNR